VKTLLILGLLFGVMTLLPEWVCGQTVSSQNENLTLPFYLEPSLTPDWVEEEDPRFRSLHRVGPFSMTNQDGKTVSDGDFREKIRIVGFFFTSCPGICATTTANMVTVQNAFEENDLVRLVSFSVMPEVDTVTVLKDYATTYKIQSRKWDLLTGDRRSIYQLARLSYFAESEMAGSDEGEGIIHSEKLLLVDGKGRIRGVYNGTLAFDMRRLIEDVRILEERS
jgi:protein SCO1